MNRDHVSLSALTCMARLLLSDEIGHMRIPRYGKDLLERAIFMSPYARAIHELAVLHARGDVGVDRDVRKSVRLFHLLGRHGVYEDKYFAVVLRQKSIIEAGEKVRDNEEDSLRATTARSKECFVMVLGATGGGKTSIVRSLCDMKVVSERVPTELACVNRVYIFSDGRYIMEEEVDELRFNSESLHAAMSRAVIKSYRKMEEDLTNGFKVEGNVHDCGNDSYSLYQDGEIENDDDGSVGIGRAHIEQPAYDQHIILSRGIVDLPAPISGMNSKSETSEGVFHINLGEDGVVVWEGMEEKLSPMTKEKDRLLETEEDEKHSDVI